MGAVRRALLLGIVPVGDAKAKQGHGGWDKESSHSPPRLSDPPPGILRVDQWSGSEKGWGERERGKTLPKKEGQWREEKQTEGREAAWPEVEVGGERVNRGQ